MSNETDLDWLARNVHAWSACATHVKQTLQGRIWANEQGLEEKSGWYTKQQWLARRAEMQNKPSWAGHQWPQIFQNEDGHWFGARAGWDFKAHIGGGWKGEGVSLLRDDGEYLQSGEVLGDWRDTLEQRPEGFKSFTSIEENQEREMKQDNGWFERGELPPVGVDCQAYVDERWVDAYVVGFIKNGAVTVDVRAYQGGVKSGLRIVTRNAAHFRPIRTERDVLIEIIKKTDDTDDRIADAILAAGFSLGAK